MLYINNRDKPFVLYDDAVDMVIANGVDAKRAYIFLAALGVRGVFGRVINESGMGYLEPRKIAVKGNDIVVGVDVCRTCRGITVKT